MALETRQSTTSSTSIAGGGPARADRKHVTSGDSYAAQVASLVPRDGVPVQMRAAGIAALQMKTPKEEATELETRDSGHSLGRQAQK